MSATHRSSHSSNPTVTMHTVYLPNGESLEITELLWKGLQRRMRQRKWLLGKDSLEGEGVEQRATLLELFGFAFFKLEGEKAYCLLKAYLDKGGDPNLNDAGNTLLMLALRLSDFRVVSLLLERDDLDVNWKAGEDSPVAKPLEMAQAAIHDLIVRDDPRDYQRKLNLYTWKSTYEQSEAQNTPVLHPDEEIQQLWQKLLAKGLDCKVIDRHGNNPLAWATKRCSMRIIPLLVEHYTQAHCLMEMLLQSNALDSGSALEFMIQNFSSASEDFSYQYLHPWLQAIDSSHQAAFQKTGGLKRASLIATIIKSGNLDILAEFEAACSRCQIPLTKEVWISVLNQLTQMSEKKKHQFQLPKKELSDILEYVLKKIGPDTPLLPYLKPMLPASNAGNYKVLEVLLATALKLNLFNVEQKDEETQWNLLCFLVANLKDCKLNKSDLKTVQNIWKIAVNAASAEARQHAERLLNLGNIWSTEVTALIQPDGLNLPVPVTQTHANAQASAIVLDAQSTHRTIVHHSTSLSEKVLKNRYQSHIESPSQREKLWKEIDRYYMHAWLSGQNKTSYLNNLQRSAENNAPIPGDTQGYIKQALVSRWNWIKPFAAHERVIVDLLQLLSLHKATINQEAFQRQIQFLRTQFHSANAWLFQTYQLFKQFIKSTTYRDPVSQSSLEEVFLEIFLAIAAPSIRSPLTSEEKVALLTQLRIAMIEIVHQYGAKRPSCPSGAHNLLIEAVGKGGLPGIYSFSDPAERVHVIQALKAKLSVEDFFLALPDSEKVTWFHSQACYEKAVNTCQEAFKKFEKFGENLKFHLFTPSELKCFQKTHQVNWQAWMAAHANHQYTDEQLIISALRGLSKKARHQYLADSAVFSEFVKTSVPLVSATGKLDSLLQTVKQHFQSDQMQMVLLDYSQEDFGQSLPRWVDAKWNTYYCVLKLEEIECLLSQLGHSATGNLLKDRNAFAMLDRDRVLQSRAFTMEEQQAIRQAYDQWLDPCLMEIDEDIDILGEAVVPVVFAENEMEIEEVHERASGSEDEEPPQRRLRLG